MLQSVRAYMEVENIYEVLELLLVDCRLIINWNLNYILNRLFNNTFNILTKRIFYSSNIFKPLTLF